MVGGSGGRRLGTAGGAEGGLGAVHGEIAAAERGNDGSMERGYDGVRGEVGMMGGSGGRRLGTAGGAKGGWVLLSARLPRRSAAMTEF